MKKIIAVSLVLAGLIAASTLNVKVQITTNQAYADCGSICR